MLTTDGSCHGLGDLGWKDQIMRMFGSDVGKFKRVQGDGFKRLIKWCVRRIWMMFT